MQNTIPKPKPVHPPYAVDGTTVVIDSAKLGWRARKMATHSTMMPSTTMTSRPSITRPAKRMSRYASHHESSMDAAPTTIHQRPMSIDIPLKAAPKKLPTNAASPVAKAKYVSNNAHPATKPQRLPNVCEM